MRFPRVRWTTLLATVVILSCSSPNSSAPSDALGELQDGSTVDVENPEIIIKDNGSQDGDGGILFDGYDGVFVDIQMEIVEGGFLWPCSGPADCDSTYCIGTQEFGSVCTILCEEECPLPDWRCKNKEGSGGDLVFLCVPPEDDLCIACSQDTDCGGSRDRCMIVGNDGDSYCTKSCLSDAGCPEDYECKDVEIEGGALEKQCWPKTNSCVCLGEINGAVQACSIENSYGKCFGDKVCQGADGWSECSATDPAPETCDGLDNDCDGDKDNGLVGEPCSYESAWGVCEATMICQGASGWTCPTHVPSEEICDGIDNDCNGNTDDSFPELGLPCDSPDDEDECAEGFWECDTDMGATVCVGDVAHVEICNGLDDDCDGVADDPWPLRGQPCDSSDADSCKNGIWLCLEDGTGISCVGDVNQVEVCDGQDNDCDGTADDGFPDFDYDGIADCVDPDDDGDGVNEDGDGSGVEGDNPCTVQAAGCDDNCPKVYNPEQNNNDGDLQGDLCDPDDDNDGVNDPMDNCHYVYNPLQTDTNGDHIGDACDDDADGDGVLDDGDGSGDPSDNPCEPGETLNCDDNCPTVANADQLNYDGDALGDACDPDIDGDGALNSVDCNDTNEFVFPGAVEVCNQIDDNCDNSIDPHGSQGCTVFYIDADGDDFGYAGLHACVCGEDGEPPYTAISLGDCNDSNPNVNPLAAENCNAIDDDCNGTVDDYGAAGCTLKYKDSDGDTFGVFAMKQCVCPANPGPYVATATGDCDDTDNLVYPGAGEYCNGKDDNCNYSTDEEGSLGCNVFYLDMDGDDYGISISHKCLCEEYMAFTATQVGDCDDGDYLIHPGVEENCDGEDNDCDGSIDEEGAHGCLLYYQDVDSDSWGNSKYFKCLCGPNATYTTLKGGDCDDNDVNINAGTPETCNGIDDDCDGIIDNNVTNCTVYYEDSDHDGFGVTELALCLCSPQGTYNVTVGGDCNDYLAAVNPDEDEICDGLDNDCDGTVDNEGAAGCTVFYRDNDEDGFGNSFQYKCLCAPTGFYTAVQAMDCNDEEFFANPGQSEMCDGIDNDCDYVIDDPGSNGCIHYYSDSDGDGYGVTSNNQCACAPTGAYSAEFGGDCNDASFFINPGMEELCDGVDNNCLGGVDEGFPDSDLDGLKDCLDNDKDGDGDPTGTDCDDLNPLVNHYAEERCNEIDDNCNSIVDEENAIGCQSYYYDNDLDGYGVFNNWKCLCEASGLYSSTSSTDCNDNKPLINPLAIEQCDGVDNNCNSMIDEGDPIFLCGDIANANPQCYNGQCKIYSCDTNYYNIDNVYENGCECERDQQELEASGNFCANPLDIGDFVDTVSRDYYISGNLVPGGDEDWYAFDAVDTVEDGRNSFSIRVELVGDASAYVMDVFQDGCDILDNLLCEETSAFDWYVNFIAADTGEIPCSYEIGPSGTGNVGEPGTHFCEDHSARYYVLVRRKLGVPIDCSGYVLRVRNGDM